MAKKLPLFRGYHLNYKFNKKSYQVNFIINTKYLYLNFIQYIAVLITITQYIDINSPKYFQKFGRPLSMLYSPGQVPWSVFPEDRNHVPDYLQG